MGIENPVFAQSATREFLKAAIKDPRQPIVTVAGKNTRDLNIVGTYFLTAAKLGEIGNVYRVSRERVRQIVKSGIRDIWEAGSPELQARFPLEEIRMKKPGSQETYKRFGITERAARLSREGKTAEVIKRDLGLSINQLVGVRTYLRRRGIELPYLQKSPAVRNEKLAERLRGLTDDAEIQRLLSSVNLSFYKRFSQREVPLLISIRKTAAGFYFSRGETSFFVESLIRAGIPIGIIESTLKGGPRAGLVLRYYFIVAQHLERAREILLKDPELGEFRQNRVQKVCGPEEVQPPSVSKIYSSEFRRPAKLLFSLGVQVRGRNNFKLSDFLTLDCPVAVFKYDTGYYYPVEDEDRLSAFFIKKNSTLRVAQV